MFGGLHVTQRSAQSSPARARQQLDLEKLRAAVSSGKPHEELRVTKRWLRRALDELEASRSSFRSPIITLAHASGHD